MLKCLFKWFWNLFYPPVKKKKTKKLMFYYSVFEKTLNFNHKESSMLVLTDSQFVELSIAPVTKAGNPASVDGVPLWTVSNLEVFDLVVSEDGLSAKVTATGKLGACQVNVSVDADMGEGVTTISGVLDLEVKAGPAVALGISAGVAQDK